MEAILPQKDLTCSEIMVQYMHYVHHAQSKDHWETLSFQKLNSPIDFYCSY